MKAGFSFILAIVVTLLVILAMSVFTVDQRQYAIIFQLGEVRQVIDQPGLYLKWPFIQNIRYFDRRILTLKWRIVDPKLYYVSVQGDEARAKIRLNQTVNAGLREEFGKKTVHDVVSGERDKIMELMRNKADKDARTIGVEIVDVRLKRVELPTEVSEAVYRRMEAERKRNANQLRSEGSAEAEKIRADADKQREVIIAEAYRDAQKLKGEGDAKSTALYAQAFGQNPEFYAFYRSLEAYRASFKSKQDVLVVDPSSDFFKYMKSVGGESGRAK
ncbi:MAG: hflC [Proteobacteria bacterium]|nr:hflC [Pseudomonadota bacterium]